MLQAQPERIYILVNPFSADPKYFRSLIPQSKEYYLHHFTIRKENKGNYYGLIFGSNHTFGMEKFLKVCWQKDPLSGEANFNIENDFPKDTLFYKKDTSIKKETIKSKIKEKILSGLLIDNRSGFEYTMRRGGRPELFSQVVKELEKQNLVKREGNLNFQNTNIHKIREPFLIKVINNEID